MKKIITLATLITPSLVLAQTGNITNATSLVTRLVTISNVFIYLLISLAVIYIIWSVVQYFIKGNSDDETRSKAGMNIFYGIVGLFIIMSLWGLVSILLHTFGTDANAPKDKFPTADFISRQGSSQGGSNPGGEGSSQEGSNPDFGCTSDGC